MTTRATINNPTRITDVDQSCLGEAKTWSASVALPTGSLPLALAEQGPEWPGTVNTLPIWGLGSA